MKARTRLFTSATLVNAETMNTSNQSRNKIIQALLQRTQWLQNEKSRLFSERQAARVELRDLRERIAELERRQRVARAEELKGAQNA